MCQEDFEAINGECAHGNILNYLCTGNGNVKDLVFFGQGMKSYCRNSNSWRNTWSTYSDLVTTNQCPGHLWGRPEPLPLSQPDWHLFT